MFTLDCWAAYNQIPNTEVRLRFKHANVNHLDNFTRSTTAVRTNNIENFWMTAKRKLK